MLHSNPNTTKKKTKRVLRVLLDSGSNGDLLFMREGQHSIIPTKERFSPQKWKTSNGTFTTKNIGSDDNYNYNYI